MAENTVTDSPIQPIESALVPIVAIGASVGGSEAMRDLLANLSSTTGMAFVYIQHLDPTQTESLIDLLAPYTTMPVTEAHHLTKVVPDCVYVIPADEDLEVVDGVFTRAIHRLKSVIHMPIDQFFLSLTERQKEGSIAVLLSGSASDGTLGLRAIKAAGGITFVQDYTARYQSMPRSAILEGVADKVLPPDEIAAELERLSQQTAVFRQTVVTEGVDPELNEQQSQSIMLQTGAEDDLRNIIQLLRRAMGVDFSHYKVSTIRRRIVRRTLLFKFESLHEYVNYLRLHPEELAQLYDDLLINVTSFFRDADTMDYVQKVLLPQIVREKKAQEPLRIWVPACSTGQEAYSLAMLLLEVLGDRGGGTRPIQLFATDLSESAVAKARLGSYTRGEVMGVSAQRLQRFFTKVDDHYRINKVVRDLCVFAPHNLLKDPPFSRLDLISCRNLLIYLDNVLQRKAIVTFHYALNPNGHLILGKSETVGTSAPLFSQLEKNYKIFARKNDVDSRATFTMAPRSMEVDHSMVRSSGSKRIAMTDQNVERPSTGNTAFELDKAVDSLLLTQYVPASVVVNQDLEILQFRGSTGLFLEPAPGKASLNLIKMARPSLVFELRNIVHKVQKSGETVRKSGLEIKIRSKTHYVAIEAVPLDTATEERLFLIIFEEVDSPVTPNTKTADARNRRIRELESELTALREDMRSIIEEQEASNEELQSANEEIISSNEELQSINEELETSKEEIESTNEELLTINQELQVRNDQLSEAHQFSEDIFGTIREATLVLDTDLRVKSANPAFYRLFDLVAETTERRLIYELDNRQWDVPELRLMLTNIVTSDAQFQGFELTYLTAKMGEKRLSLNARRVVRQKDSILLAIEDVTERQRAQQLQAEQQLRQQAEERLRVSEEQRDNILSLFSQAPVALAILKGDDFVIDLANERVLEYWGRTREQVMQKPLFEALPEVANQGFEELLNQVYATRQKVISREATANLLRNRRIEKTYIDFVYEPYFEITGDITGIMVVANEITDQVAARQQIEQTAMQLRTLLENTPDVISRWDRSLQLTFANPAFAEKMGRPYDDLLHKTLQEMRQPESFTVPYMQKLRQTLITGQPQTYYNEFVKDDTVTQFFSRMVPEFDESGSVRSVLAIARDITELQQTTENLQAVLNSSGMAIAFAKPVRDEQQVITNFQLATTNREFNRMVGKTMGSLVGNMITDLTDFLWQSQTISILQEAMETGQPFVEERLDPTTNQWILITLRQYDGGVVLTGQNVTSLKEAEQQQHSLLNQLEETNQSMMVLSQLRQQLRERGELLRSTSHDLRGNFGIIQGAASLLSMASTDEERSQMLSMLQRNMQQATRMLTELLDVARLEAGQEERQISSFDVARLLAELTASLQSMAVDKGLSLQQSGPDSLLVLGDSMKVKRIAQNLLLNAIKYTQQGQVLVGWQAGPDDDHWQLIVSDTGPGLSAASTQGGEGIGLTIIRQLCQLLNALMVIDSQPGAGTRFTLTFPRTYVATGKLLGW